MTGPTLVLVHGAFHGPWCFDLVRPLLDQHGVPTIAPTLPLETLAGDAAAVSSAIDDVDGDAVLFGHSYGGTVITWAGERPNVRALVYLSAGMPDVGEGVGSGPRATTDPPPVMDGFTIGPDRRVYVEPATALELFYPDADPELAKSCAARLRHGHLGIGEAVPHAAWRSRPSHYIVCRDDRVQPAATQRWLAERANATVHELPGDHSPFLARPTELVDILLTIVDAPR